MDFNIHLIRGLRWDLVSMMTKQAKLLIYYISQFYRLILWLIILIINGFME